VQITIINRQKKIPISRRAVKRTVLKTLKILKLNSSGELNIIYVNNRFIRQLNRRFSGRDRSTDVLCFDLSGGRQLLADIVISTQKAEENSRLFKTSAAWEARLYLIHGILHLAGYRDYRKKDRLRMQRRTLQILKSLR
jgi:probable rRNA maturation factor